MKTIVISGACSNVGKTTLAKAIAKLLPGAVFIKIGHGVKKDGCLDLFYPSGSSYQKILADHSKADFLIIESNRILTELEPDLCVYLDADGPLVKPSKPSASLARQKADLIRGCGVSGEKIHTLAQRVGIKDDQMRELCFLTEVYPSPVTLVILAGGESSRMGADKAFLSVEGKSLLRYIYDLLSPSFDEVIISGPEINMTERFSSIVPEARVIPDASPGEGPLMGIYSSLTASSNPVNFIIACDIPAINFFLIRELLRYSFQYDIVVPSFRSGEYEPLFSVYNKGVSALAKMLLDQKRRRVADLFPLGKTKIIEAKDSNWYMNLNTPQDFNIFIKNIKHKMEGGKIQ